MFCSKVLIIVVDDCYNFEYFNVKVCLMKRIGRDNKIVVVVGIVIDDFRFLDVFKFKVYFMKFGV